MKLRIRRARGVRGCDDAPVVQVPLGGPKHVTLVMPYYENPRMLRQQVLEWARFPRTLLAYFDVIIVDDGSPITPAVDVLRTCYPQPFPMKLFRIREDVRWNWIAARNIAMHEALPGWCVLTDMDHVVSRETFTALVHGEHDPKVIYRFSRREHTGEKIKPHPNSWFMTRAMFWKIGGYDEALSGHYGTDGDYRRRCAATAPIRILADELVRHEFVLDSSTTKYLRKQPEDRAVADIVGRRQPGWVPKTLTFAYDRVRL